ncbi:hypothetical protein NE237_024412 [Protea cynaroides]|uniref:RING-type E3 ubiquitin transferase n=1 Tax=Protea cynaroides TaxID=273540 RepID=A0A9Q0K709_9MAGN|nr:hypothetical protein NE237_024412 [Protea cynaroides]
MSSTNNDSGIPSEYQVAQYNMDVSIMRTALILFLLVIFVVFTLNLLHLYARCVVRRRSRNHIIRLVDLRLTDENVNSSVNFHEPPKNGLESSVIASLPTFAYKISDGFDKTDAKECAVCLGTLQDEEMVKVLPNCKHMFHVECIDMWLNSNSTCPVCRTEAKPVDSEAPSEINGTSDAVVQIDLQTDSSNSMVESSQTVHDIVAQSVKEGESSSSVKEGESSRFMSDRLTSFRRILSRGRSSKRNQLSGQSEGQSTGGGDLERQ